MMPLGMYAIPLIAPTDLADSMCQSGDVSGKKMTPNNLF